MLKIIKRFEEKRKTNYCICECICGRTVTVHYLSVVNKEITNCGCIKLEIPKRVKNLIGNKYGKLTVLNIGKIYNNKSYWVCQCECGNICQSRSDGFKSGKFSSCGCTIFKDLTGKRFGKLLVIQESTKRSNIGRILWECLCDCGKTPLCHTSSLTLGKSKTCGCFHIEALIKRNTTHGLSKTRKYKNFYDSRSKASRLQRIPKWSNLEKIKEIYKNCPEGYQVDHIYPLQGELISGLHIPENLQYLPASENRSKSNKFQPIRINTSRNLFNWLNKDSLVE